MSRIRRAEPSEAGALAQVVADAFFDLVVCQWLVPDPAERRRVLRPDFEIIVEHGIQHGTVHTTDELDAVAVWFSNAPEGIGEIRDYDARLAAAVAPHTPRFVILDDVMHEARDGSGALVLLLPERHFGRVEVLHIEARIDGADAREAAEQQRGTGQ